MVSLLFNTMKLLTALIIIIVTVGLLMAKPKVSYASADSEKEFDLIVMYKKGESPKELQKKVEVRKQKSDDRNQMSE